MAAYGLRHLKDGKDGSRRLFIVTQAAKGVAGAALGAGFCLWAGPPDGAEMVALAGLAAPLGLAVLGWTPVSLAWLEQAGLVLFAALIGWLMAMTGGVTSPLLVWLALVPAEAALAGTVAAVTWAGLAAGAALALVTLAQAMAVLPASRLVMPLWQATALSMLIALAQAALIAAAAITRRKAADRAAEDGAAMHRFLAENAMDLITRHDAAGRIRFASPASRALLGRDPAELEGLLPAMLVHPDDLKTLQAALAQAGMLGRAGTVELRLRHRDGRYVWSEMRLKPARESLSDAAEIVAVTRDISGRKAQEAALTEARDAAMEASRAKSRFLANMSHELRTPLNAIIGFSEVMAREMFGPLGGARYQDYSRLIHESGQHLLELINGVLDMSKIEAGKFELYEEVFALEDVAEAAMRFVRLAAERAGVRLTLAIAPQARSLYGDQRAIKQMLINLLTNAIKYTPSGGDVAIRAAAAGPVVTIAVADTGTGISQADLERLGRPFEQVEGAMTRGKEGTGLGLALVKALAAMHGGEAVLQSALGEGTVVTLRLPFAGVDAQGARLAADRGA
jgi:cell cycle sensor histidine kinase DivJ